jgi:hypothetical protein
MNNYLMAIFDAISRMSSAAVISGFILAFLLASPMALAYAKCRRKEEGNDAEEKAEEKEEGNDAEGKKETHAMLLVVMAMVANLIGMAIASGYSTFTFRSAQLAANQSPPRVSPRTQRPPGQPGGLAGGVTRNIFETSDANHDGLLSVDEATIAATALIRIAGNGKDTADAQAIGAALQKHLAPFDRRGGMRP